MANILHPDQVVTFHTTHSDLMNLNGSKCRVVEETDYGYLVEFMNIKLNVFSDELFEDDSK